MFWDEIEWDELTEDQRKEYYASYIQEMIYEWGDKAKYLTYEEWKKESEKIKTPLL